MSVVSQNNSTKSTVKPLLVCFCQLRWDFVYQRPQHVMARAVRHYDVLFFEEPIWEDVSAPELRISTRSGGVTVAVPILPHGTGRADAFAALRRLLDETLAERRNPRPWVLWYYTPMSRGFTRHLDADLCVYDNMDELSAFRGAPAELIDLEKDLFRNADLVFTGGQALYEAKRDRHPRVTAFPSSIDAAHFNRARDAGLPDPADQAAIPRPRLGYFGVIDERMDLDLVDALAERRPDWQIVMVGPVVKIDPGSLPKRPNLHWLGMKKYEELPAYLAGWDIGLMPFARNESTAFISPTKTPEYLAAGVPVVSTPILDVVRPYGNRALVEIASDANETVRKAEMLLARPRDEWLRNVDLHLAGNSWDRTWAGMHTLMADLLEARGEEQKREKVSA